WSDSANHAAKGCHFHWRAFSWRRKSAGWNGASLGDRYVGKAETGEAFAGLLSQCRRRGQCGRGGHKQEAVRHGLHSLMPGASLPAMLSAPVRELSAGLPAPFVLFEALVAATIAFAFPLAPFVEFVLFRATSLLIAGYLVRVDVAIPVNVSAVPNVVIDD